MSTNAVTPDASAVSEFLPTDRNYRMTGQLPEEKPAPATETGKDKDIDASPGDKGAETAAASEAAIPQDKVQPQKTSSSSESRWAKITRENRELRDRLSRLEGAHSAKEPQRETQQVSQPAAEASEPSALDKDPKTGEFLYKTPQQLQAAQRKHWEGEAEKRALSVWEKKSQEQALQQAEERIQQEIHKRTEQARKDHADYDTVIGEVLGRKTPAGQDFIFFPKGSAVDMFFAESPKSQEIFYEIGKNPDKYGEIFAHDAQGKFLMHPVRQLRLLGQIENKLEAKPEAAKPAKPITQAPPPAHQVSGKGTVGKDAVAQAVEDNDQDAYMKEQNARDLARRKQGK